MCQSVGGDVSKCARDGGDVSKCVRDNTARASTCQQEDPLKHGARSAELASTGWKQEDPLKHLARPAVNWKGRKKLSDGIGTTD